MKKYNSPNIEMISINTKDIMAMSANTYDDGTTYVSNGIDMQNYFVN